MEEMPKGFPLSPNDAYGKLLSVGVDVEIRAVESCKKDLPEEDQKRLISLVGYKRTIVQIDRFGFVWLSFSEIETGADFCLFPSEVCVV